MLKPYTLSISDACKTYGLGKNSIYRLIAAGEITALKFSRKTLIEAASIERYVNALPRISDRPAFALLRAADRRKAVAQM